MLKLRLTFLFLLLIFSPTFAQVIDDEEKYIVVNDYVIVASQKTYTEAKKIAMDCSKQMNLPYHSRGAVQDSISGDIVYPADTCKTLGKNADYPCTIIRGLRGVNPDAKDNGAYITVEETNNYYNLTMALYIVVIGSGNPGDEKLVALLEKAKKYYPDSYIKTVMLYYDGCSY